MRIGIIVTDEWSITRVDHALRALSAKFPYLLRRDPNAKRRAVWTVFGNHTLQIERAFGPTLGWQFDVVAWFADPKHRPLSEYENERWVEALHAWRMKVKPSGLWLDLGGL